MLPWWLYWTIVWGGLTALAAIAFGSSFVLLRAPDSNAATIVRLSSALLVAAAGIAAFVAWLYWGDLLLLVSAALMVGVSIMECRRTAHNRK